jgi:hypothetical protein
MKLRGIEVSETVCRLLYRRRLAEVAGKALSVISLVLSSVWHVRGNIDQSGHRWICPGFGNYVASITRSDQNAGPVL